MYDLRKYPAQNRRDIELFLQRRLNEPEFALWLEERNWTVDRAVSDLAERSENNFMYLHYVLPAIASGEFRDPTVELPIGLRGYYQDHWRGLELSDPATFGIKVDVLEVLAVVRGPVTARLISEVLGRPLPEVRRVLREWEEFLHTITEDGVTSYRLYHSSFQDFPLSTDVIQDNEPGRWRGLLADYFMKEMLS